MDIDQFLYSRKHWSRTFVNRLRKPEEVLSIPLTELQTHLDQGYRKVSSTKHRVRVSRAWSPGQRLELDLWLILYDLGASQLSHPLEHPTIEEDSMEFKFDLVALLEHSLIIAECMDYKTPNSNKYKADITKLTTFRSLAGKYRKKWARINSIATLLAHQTQESQHFSAIAEDNKITLLSKTDIRYYLDLSRRIGMAARFQFMSDILQGHRFADDDIIVPAVRARIGKTAYQFTASAKDLLKCCSIAHRASGSEESYQRLTDRTRVRKLQQYIEDGGAIPTNIILSFRSDLKSSRRITFMPGEQTDGVSNAGRLRIPKEYGLAWIIDGQHRLLAFGDDLFDSEFQLPVLAYTNLEAEEAAEMFVTINSKQKNVSAGLLAELASLVHMSSKKPKDRQEGIASAVALKLHASAESALQGLIRLPDSKNKEPISFLGLVRAIKASRMIVFDSRNWSDPVSGPTWSSRSRVAVEETFNLFNSLMSSLKSMVENQGLLRHRQLLLSNSGIEGVSRNVQYCIECCIQEGISIHEIKDSDRILDLFTELSRAFCSLKFDDVSQLKSVAGSGGPARVSVFVGFYTQQTVPSFGPSDLTNRLSEYQNVNARDMILRIADSESIIKLTVESLLAETYGDDPEEWLGDAIPDDPATDAKDRQIRDKDPVKHPVTDYFNLIDYRKIVDLRKNESIFKDLFYVPWHEDSNPKKKDLTSWLVKLNSIRNKANHQAGVRLTKKDEADLQFIERDILSKMKKFLGKV